MHSEALPVLCESEAIHLRQINKPQSPGPWRGTGERHVPGLAVELPRAERAHPVCLKAESDAKGDHEGV